MHFMIKNQILLIFFFFYYKLLIGFSLFKLLLVNVKEIFLIHVFFIY